MHTKFLIRDLKSEEDADSIERMLEETAGVERAQVQFERQRADVDFDATTVPIETLMKKIADLGFQAVEGETAR